MSITFYGTVQDEHNKPIARARIMHACGNECRYTAQSDLSDVTGMYSITFDGGNFHVLTCSKKGYEAQTETHGARGARRIRCDFKLTGRIHGKKPPMKKKVSSKSSRSVTSELVPIRAGIASRQVRRSAALANAGVKSRQAGTRGGKPTPAKKKKTSVKRVRKPTIRAPYISLAVPCGAPCKTKPGPCARLTMRPPCWQHGGGLLDLVEGVIRKISSKKDQRPGRKSTKTVYKLPSRSRKKDSPQKSRSAKRVTHARKAPKSAPLPVQRSGKAMEQIERRRSSQPASRAGRLDAVEFTAIHPSEGVVEKWLPLLVYAHLESALEDVIEDARQFKDKLFPPRIIKPSFGAQILHGETLTIVPSARGVTFNPNKIVLQWEEAYHRAEFRYRVAEQLADDAARGIINIYAGPLLVGTVRFAMLCSATNPLSSKMIREVSRMYRQSEIFFSYSHQDSEIVGAICEYAKTLHDVLIDVDKLRSGDDWSEKLMDMIRKAKIFQLFWSSHSCRSSAVEKEWRFALELDKPDGFICPVYWENELPPIPLELSGIHFQHMKLPAFAKVKALL